MRLFFVILLCGGFLSGCQKRTDENPTTLTLYVAASLSDVIQELGNAFAEDTDTQMIYNSGGSGALARQMIAAPRGDLFFSANTEWMERAMEAGAIDSGSVHSTLANQLVLVAHRDSSLKIDSPQALCLKSIELLSIGDPAFVPAGSYAKQWLEGIACGESNLWESIKNRVIPAIDVRAALAQVLSSHEALAIVYHSDYLSRAEHLQMLYRVPVESGPEIRYAFGRLSKAGNPLLADKFVDFLQTEQASDIFQKYGFIVIP